MNEFSNEITNYHVIARNIARVNENCIGTFTLKCRLFVIYLKKYTLTLYGRL